MAENVPNHIHMIAESRRSDMLRTLTDRRELCQKQLSIVPDFPGQRTEYAENQRNQVFQALEEVETQIETVSQLTGMDLAQRFCSAEMTELKAMQEAQKMYQGESQETTKMRQEVAAMNAHREVSEGLPPFKKLHFQ